MILFSPTTTGFYDTSLSSVIPSDAVEIDGALYTELLDAQSRGGVIVAGDDGMPTWKDAPLPVLTYAQELTTLTVPYNSDRDTLCAAWLRAAVADGTEETVRKEDVESEISELDAKYDADVAALKTKYGVS